MTEPSLTIGEKMMFDYAPCIAASSKLYEVPQNFYWHMFEWVGNKDPRKCDKMKVTGAEFREAKKGFAKGMRNIRVPHTTCVVIINRDDIRKAEEKLHTYVT